MFPHWQCSPRLPRSPDCPHIQEGKPSGVWKPSRSIPSRQGRETACEDSLVQAASSPGRSPSRKPVRVQSRAVDCWHHIHSGWDNFIDLTKAFDIDTVDRSTLWYRSLTSTAALNSLLTKSGHSTCTWRPRSLSETSLSLSTTERSKVVCSHPPSSLCISQLFWAPWVTSDVKGCCCVLELMENSSILPVYAHRPKPVKPVSDLLYADDSVLVADNAEHIQTIVDRFAEAEDMMGLKINIAKTELLYQPPPGAQVEPHSIEVHGEALKTAQRFTLGNTVTNNNSAELEVERRPQLATKAYGAPHKRLWSQHDISIKTTAKVYIVAVLPCLLYATECTTLYWKNIKPVLSALRPS